MPKLYASV